MKAFDFNQVRPTDAMVIVASVQLGIGLITLPRIITEAVQTSDGWISIMVGGSFTILMGWIIGIVIKRNPNENIFEMTSRLLGGWTARLLAVLYAVTMTLNFALIIRLIGVLAKTYFFERTPMEVIVLAFTLVVIYCAAGSRIAMLRLNLLFLPLILCSIGIIHMFNLGHLDLDNLKPMFTASWSAIGNGSLKSLLSYNAFFVILFYGNLLQRSDKLPRMIAGGMSIVLIVYLLVFLFTVGVLGLHTTMNVLYPTIEMAKEAEVPGGFFERLQSVFFAVWVMAIFTSAVFSLDMSVLMLSSLFRKVKKITWILWISPLAFFIGMIPDNWHQLSLWQSGISSVIYAISLPVPLLLLAASRIKGSRDYG